MASEEQFHVMRGLSVLNTVMASATFGIALGFILWITGGIRPQSAVDIEQLRRDLTGLQLHDTAIDTRLDSMRDTETETKMAVQSLHDTIAASSVHVAKPGAAR